jgi:hypothetical protein
MGVVLRSVIGGMNLLSFDYGFLEYDALVSSLLSVLVVHTITVETEKNWLKTSFLICVSVKGFYLIGWVY